MKRYKIADVVFDADIRYRYTVTICQQYEYDGDDEPKFIAKITNEDIERERSNSNEQYQYPDSYLESLALFRKLCDYLLERGDGMVFHSSAVMVDGEVYLFTAPSGTGKSTHTRLWRELLGDKAIMVNDDKPIIRLIDGEFYVYGTPWTGKHHLGENTRGKLKAICKISKSKENRIRESNNREMLLVIFEQTIRPTAENKLDNLINIIDKMLNSVDKYYLECNMDISAAKLSYNTMKGDK